MQEVSANKAKNKFYRTKNFWIIASIILLLSVAAGIGFFYSGNDQNESVSTNQNQSTSLVTENQSSSKENVQNIDLAGEAITEEMRKLGVDMGFLSSTNLKETSNFLPIKTDNLNPDESEKYPERKPLQDLIPANEASPQKNLLVWEKYNIIAPLKYVSFSDVFETNPDGTSNFKKTINNDPVDSPIQLKLVEGVVHMPFSPMPGEVGNSYIIGHSSNFSSVKSDYNTIFKPIEKKSQPGEEFIIYDHKGRALKFRVFETLAVSEKDVALAYKNFGDRRVVTLQASILETVNGKLLPTKRWLTRAELVVE